MNGDRPRVLEGEAPERAATRRAAAPQVTFTDRGERIVPVQPAPRLPEVPSSRRSRLVSFGLTGLAVGFAGWLAVDAYWWVAAAFERSTALGTIAAVAVAATVAGAAAIIGREAASLWRLRSVEAVRQRFAADIVTPREAQRTIADVLAAVPRERAVQDTVEAFQRQVQPHHSVSQQLEILSRTVMGPLDARAQDHVRAAVLRAVGITAISPTALTDALFFLAVGIRMVRRIATAYGHRPTAAATVHLLRRLVVEAGKLGAVDIAGATLAQQLGGAVAERLATTAAESFYAGYRMARLGVIVMDLCRPIPFRDDEVPRITALVANVIRQRAES